MAHESSHHPHRTGQHTTDHADNHTLHVSPHAVSHASSRASPHTAPPRRHPRALWGVFFAVLALVLFANTSLLLHGPLTGRATSVDGTISLCIDYPPTVNVSSCLATAFAGIPYTCIVDAIDAQGNIFNYSVLRLSGPAAGDPLLIMVEENLTFTANNSQVGNYTLQFTVTKASGCSASGVSVPFNLTINSSSHAPYLVAPIPSKNWTANTLLIAFDLDSYFADPDSDPLAYSVDGNGNIGISITNGEVLLTPAGNWCGIETVTFTATDPTNLTATSNAVTLTVLCPSSSSGSGGSGSSGGGGGGGGGSAATRSSSSRCVEDYQCFAWSTCQLTRAVNTVSGNSQLLEVTGVGGMRRYTIPDEISKDPDVYYQGFSYRQCIDTRSCGNAKEIYHVKPCSYVPSCSDRIQNQDETAIDCGGSVCAACSICTDGIQNGQEEDIDCGGPLCPTCATCSNGKLDGKELGLDCGGPDCPTCATCFDSVQNQDETGVDCGGEFCNACKETQFPLGASLPVMTIILLLLIALVLALLFFAAIKRRFLSLFMAFVFKHKKRNRTIIIPTSLKDDILRRLAELEASLEKQPMLKSQEDLARIIRDYFKESLHLDFEFTYEELVIALDKAKLNSLLASIMKQFFTRISTIEFSGVKVSSSVMAALIQETRELVYQTSVLTTKDLKEREKDLDLHEIPKDAPALDRAYLLLSQIQQCLQFKKLEIAAALYNILGAWYASAPVHEQRVIYDDFRRVYEEYVFAGKGAAGKASKVPSGGSGSGSGGREGGPGGVPSQRAAADAATQEPVPTAVAVK